MDRQMRDVQDSESGFTLVEVMIAGVVLVLGLVSVAYCFALGLGMVATAQQDTVARQKAREAMECVFAARDTGNLTFDQICNVGTGPNCIFLVGLQPLNTAPLTGIVNNFNDVGPMETVWQPPPNGILGDTGGVQVPLSQYQRQIQITSITADLIQITVTIQYTTVKGLTRSVTLNGLMSPYA